MAPKCFHYARCMCGGQKKTHKKQTNKKTCTHIRINLYSDDLLFFPNTLNLTPSHKYYLRTDLLQGVGGTACRHWQSTSARERPAADHYWKLGWLLTGHFEKGYSSKSAHIGREHADLWNLCSPTPSILRVAEASEELVEDHKSFLLF